MARPSKQSVSSDEALSNGSNSSEEEQVNEQINDEEDEEELEAVARSAHSDEDNSPASDDEGVAAEDGDADEEDEVNCTIMFSANCLHVFAFLSLDLVV